MTNKSPLVSIIIPVYNSAKYLQTCLESVLTQTYQNLEIILVDDGSTDESTKLVDDYKKSNSKIKAIHQDNAGLSSARNSGLKIATGDYVTFIDSDDQVEPGMLEDMLNAISKTDATIAVCSFKEIYEDGRTVHFNPDSVHEKTTYTTIEALKAMLKEQGFMLSTTMKLFPTKYFKGIEFPVGMLHEDVGTTYKLFKKADKIVFLPDEYYIYNHHRNSIISAFNNKKFDLIKLTDEMCDDLDKSYPELQDVTKLRRMRARFSLLRQIPLSHPRRKSLQNYLRINQEFITKNSESSKKDKLALSLAKMSPRFFQLAYKLFK